MSKNVPQTTQKGQTPQDALMTAFKKDLEDITPYLEKLLPHKGQIGRFAQMTLVAILRDPTLLFQNRRSLLLALLWCAQKDLEPGVDDGCWLVPFKKIVTPVPSYKGLIKKAVETETATDVQPYGIYAHDDFEFGLGLDPYLKHQPPKLGADRGDLIGAYVVITKPDGVKRFHVMDRPAIEKIRNSSAGWNTEPEKQEKSPWKKWELAMFLKTVIKQGLKYLPVKPAFRDLLYEDGRIEAGESVAALFHESGEELPLGLATAEEEPPSAPEPTDTSEFDKLVEEKLQGITDAKEYKTRLQHVEAFIKEIAASQKKANVTPEMVKANAAKKFLPYVDDKQKHQLGFWKTFEAWETKKYPAPPPAAAPPEDTGGKPETSPTINECFIHGPFEGDDCPVCAQKRGEPDPAGSGDNPPDHPAPPAAGATDPTFEGRRIALWDEIIDKKIPLSELADPKFGVTELKHITPENFGTIKWFADNYQPPKKGRKK